MPRFVILTHDHPLLHWDFMLEADKVLMTWRLASPPLWEQPIAAERIGDHRLIYLDYEGLVSRGRGSVTCWDAGAFEWLEDLEDRKVVRLQGRRVNGTFRLERVSAEKWVGQFVGPLTEGA
jgi:hypothetical protein